MLLRKINAVFSLITTILLFAHAISLAAWMLSQGVISGIPSFVSRAMTVVFLIHAIISIALIISTNKGRKKSAGNHYFKLNRTTLVQRISGVLLIIFTWLHIAGTIGIMTPPPAIHAVVPTLFFTLVMAHVAISTSKAFITLGIGNAKFVGRADIVIKALCAATLIADIIGFYLYVC